MNEELTDSQVEQLKQKLLTLQDELRTLLEATETETRPVDLGEPIGRLTRMDALQQQHMAQASRRGHQSRLQQVATALAVIRDGDYGWCRKCEEPIGFARLSARPEAPFCLDCQSRTEPQR